MPTLPDSTSANSLNSDMRSLTLLKSSAHLDQPTNQQKKTIAQIYSQQARLYFQEQNWHKAIVACKNALEIAPDTADAYKILGNILQFQGRKAEALGVYAKALQINPNSAAIYANLGSFYAQQQDWQQAVDYFQQAVIIDPNLAGAYRSLAKIWEELGDTNKALECLCQAVNLEPKTLTPEEYFDFGQQLYQQGKIKEASIFYTQGVKLRPNAEQELARLVKILEELEEWQQAVAYYHQLTSLTQAVGGNRPRITKVNKPISNLLSRSQSKFPSKNTLSFTGGQSPISRSGAAKPIANNPQQQTSSSSISLPKAAAPQLLPKVSLEKSSTSAQLPSQLPSKTSKATNIAIQNSQVTTEAKQPNSAVAWNNLGSLYAQKKQWSKAISCYQEALQLDPKFSKIHRNLARVYTKLGKPEKANHYWYEAFTLKPDQIKPEEYFSLAKNLWRHQQLEKAIDCLRRAVQLKPNYDQAYLMLSKIFESLGKHQEAKAYYLQIAKNNS
ncbi:tetratricopeptide repeat protein [Pleurocapsa sp. PCC 7319]|uniref:tetratricopeptide repeat protein n=1 Tax=Pleurocapsa sp. PCC 7319 TaxID=118161 RepID=UPI000348522F|nr:tetratricopeptide repeat protein [Pleurocapsa sp. PCC 7319]